VNKKEVYRHRDLVLSQCDANELFSIELNGQLVEFRLCDLVSFKKKLFSIDLTKLFNTESADIEIIYLSHLDAHIILSIDDILGLRELLSGGFTLLQLNSVIHRALYDPFAGQLQP
jgi:hypothetical protein